MRNGNADSVEKVSLYSIWSELINSFIEADQFLHWTWSIPSFAWHMRSFSLPYSCHAFLFPAVFLPCLPLPCHNPSMTSTFLPQSQHDFLSPAPILVLHSSLLIIFFHAPAQHYPDASLRRVLHWVPSQFAANTRVLDRVLRASAARWHHLGRVGARQRRLRGRLEQRLHRSGRPDRAGTQCAVRRYVVCRDAERMKVLTMCNSSTDLVDHSCRPCMYSVRRCWVRC